MERTRFASIAVAGSVLLSCGHLRGTTGGGAAAAPVALRFAWPDGYETPVLIAHTARRRGAEATGVVARQRMVAERKGDEVWVSTRDLVARGNEPDLQTSIEISEALVQVVARDGTFVRAEGLDRALAAMKPRAPEDAERTRKALARSTALDWELMVGAWAGQKLAPGDVHRKKVAGSVPLLSAVETRLQVEYQLEARVPCTDQETERRCVALSYRAELDPDDHAATVERLRGVAAAKPDDPRPEDVHGELEALVVAEPDTLVPHRISQREHLRVRLAMPDGRVVETEERSDDAYVFSDREPGGVEPEEPGPRDL